MSEGGVSSSDRKRLVFISVFLSLLFCLLVMQFYKIQILEGEKWAQQALHQHQLYVTQPFMRGTFYSNTEVKKGHPGEKQPLVFDVEKFHVYIDPDAIPAPVKNIMAEKIFHFYPLALERKAKIYADFYKKSRSRKILSWVDREVRDEIEKWWQVFSKTEKIPKNALYFLSDFKRCYPFGSLLGRVLHTVQEEKDPHTMQSFPTGGLEMVFHSYLKGKQGKRVVLRSPRHSMEVGKVIEAAENGADVYLTINQYLQAIAEEELAKGVEEAEAKGGWAILLEPHTGEVLALAQYPFFDLTHYTYYFNEPSLQEHTRIKGTADSHEPGSVFKPLVLAVCLEANEILKEHGHPPIFSPEEKISTARGTFPGTRFSLKDGRLHSYLNMYHAMQKSSNIYMGKVVQRLIERLGDEWYREALCYFFNFGKKTGLELPAETPGLVPTPGKLHANGRPEWSIPTPYALANGHNILTTSTQMVCAYATLVNGGIAIKPTIVRKIIKGERVLIDNTVAKEKRRILHSSTCEEVVKALKYVTKLGGTSHLGDISGYTEGGKSGTSEKIIDGKYSKKHFLSSFVGFAPATDPRFVLLVTIDDPKLKWVPGRGKNHHGGVCAAPVFSKIAQRCLEYLGVAPDDPHSTDWSQEIKALKQTYLEWNSKKK